MSGVDVLAVIESCRDRWGDLNREGQSLNEARLFALRNPHPDFDSAVQSMAEQIDSSHQSLRAAGRVPVILRQRRTALARVTGATDGR